MAPTPAAREERSPLLPESVLQVSKGGSRHFCCGQLPLPLQYRQLHSETKRALLITLVSLVLIALGVAAGMRLENWRFVTALYFIAQVVTTIGYGDLTPTHDLTKAFCALYILCSLVVLAYVINLVAQQLARMHTNFIRKRLRVLEAMVFRHASRDTWKDTSEMEKMHKKMKEMYGRLNKLLAATLVVATFLAFGTIFYRVYEACSCSYGRTRIAGCRPESYASCAASGGAVHTWCSAFYMSVVSLTTVGFGDHTPKSELGRGVGVLWMLLGVASMANWVAKLSEFFIQEQLKRDDFLREEINEQTFKSIDTDGDGFLSRSEYRSFVLVRYGLVSQQDLDSIDSHYNLLDKEKTERVTLAMIQETTKQAQAAGGSPVNYGGAQP